MGPDLLGVEVTDHPVGCVPGFPGILICSAAFLGCQDGSGSLLGTSGLSGESQQPRHFVLETILSITWQKSPPCPPETSPCPVLQLPKLCTSPAVVACSRSRGLTCLKQFLPSVNTEAERLFRAVQHSSVPRGWDSSLRRRDAHGGGIVPQQIMVKVAEGFVGHLRRSGVTAP